MNYGSKVTEVASLNVQAISNSFPKINVIIILINE